MATRPFAGIALALTFAGCASQTRGPGVASRSAAYDVVILKGTIVDGTGNPWTYGDVAVAGDRLVRVTRAADA